MALRHRLLDAGLASVLALGTAALIWHNAHRLDYGLRGSQAQNVWFESDVNTVYLDMVSRWSPQMSSQGHPVFSLVAVLSSEVLMSAFHFSLDDAANGFLATTAAVWVALMYALVRRLGFDRPIAVLAALTGVLSSAGLLFMPVPETYGLASVSIMAAILIAVECEGRSWERLGALVASACTLSMTTTNWMLGLLLTRRRRDFRTWLQLSANAFLVVVAAWTIGKAFMPNAEFFTAVTPYGRYATLPSLHRIVEVSRVFVFHCVISPAVGWTGDFGGGALVGPAWPMGLSFQHSGLGSGTPWGIGAALLWVPMLVAGVRVLFKTPPQSLQRALLAFLALQLAFYVIFGLETFMYALNWLPVLILTAVYGTQQMPRVRLLVFAAFVALLGLNNLAQFDRIAEITASLQRLHPVSHPTDKHNLPNVSASPK